MKVREALVVEGLRLGRRGRHCLVRRADAVAQRHRALEHVAWHPADRGARGMRVVLGDRRGSAGQSEPGQWNDDANQPPLRGA
jgi:hypothetical protein